jgi:hypothetical protein
MSIKSRKVALASAIFSMAVLASCGGGGGGSSSTTPPPSSTPTPPTTTDAKVLVQAASAVSAGTTNKVLVCELKSDGTNNIISCDSDINPSDATYDYQYEFSNGNVLLKGNDGKEYYFNGSINPLNGKDVAGNATGQLTIPSGYSIKGDISNSNFAIYTKPSSSDIVITSSGYIQKTSTGVDISTVYSANNFVIVTDGSKTYRIKADGTVNVVNDSSNNPIPAVNATPLAISEDNILVKPIGGGDVYLIKNDGTAVKISLSTAVANDARMVKVGNDLYIAVRSGTNLYYYRNTTKSTNSPVTLGLGSSVYYTLDGSGNLYYYDTALKAIKADFTTISTTTTMTSPYFIGTSAGALVKEGPKYHLLSISGNSITDSLTVNSDLISAIDTCVNANPSYIKGESTSQIMCVDKNTGIGADVAFSWITYNNGYNGKQIDTGITKSTYDYTDFYGNKAVVYDNNTPSQTEICSVGSTASKCTPGLAVQGVIKQYNNILAMFSSGTLSIGDLLTGTSNTIFSGLTTPATGGNVSYDVTMAAAVYNAIGSNCPNGYGNQIKLSNGKVYTSNLCISAKLLKLYKQ